MNSLISTLTDSQRELLIKLFERGSMNNLAQCVKGIDSLAGFQTLAIAYSIITEKCLLNIDTGLGKTLIASGIMNILSAQKPALKWVYLCQCSNLETTANKLKSHLFSSNVVYCDSTESRIVNTFFTRKAINANVIILSYEAITQPEVEGFLFKNRDLFQGIVLDESQILSNLTSHTSRLIAAIMNSCHYRYMLSATPLRISAEQVVNQIQMLDPDMFSQTAISSFMNNFRVWHDGEVVGYKDLDELQYLLMTRMLSFSRSELGMRGEYTPIMELCASGLDNEARTPDIIDYKEDPYSNTMLRLVKDIKAYQQQGKRGIIYANRNRLKKAISRALTNNGICCDIMDGTHTSTQKAKAIVHQRFLNKELDVLITNVTTGKDLPCDYIIFYELTFDYKQMLGRGERGLQGAALDVKFILTDSLAEMKFFYLNVFQRGVLLEKLCDKDLPELHGAMHQLEQKLAQKGVDLSGLCNQ